MAVAAHDAVRRPTPEIRAMMSVEQHQVEIRRNLEAWNNKPLLRVIYNDFYKRIISRIDQLAPGRLVEIGSGLGGLKQRLPKAICSDLFPNPWLDIVCDAYRLPFAAGAVSHLILFDVFHHLERPRAFLNEAARVLMPGGKVLLFEPFISMASYPVFGLFHHEPVGMRHPFDLSEVTPPSRYYAAQGSATRLFFRGQCRELLAGWNVTHLEAFSAFAYLFSGGYSKPAMYPAAVLPAWMRMDRMLSRWPRVFGARCLVEIQRRTEAD